MIETNLWKETIETLAENAKTWDNVKFVIDNSGYPNYIPFRISKDNFKEIALKYDYDAGFGHACVPSSLKIVGDDWWLERHEYDGQECWVFKSMPDIPIVETKVLEIDKWDGCFVLENDTRKDVVHQKESKES